ncbi:MAG: DUF1566 domain-containing protein [Candidatus Contendobacter sp.]|nr:DUF1566 domain-containing protein [Candidatus Contendobacter sp.]
MKITTLCRLVLLGAPALLIWPATAPWADTNPNFNPNVTATTPDGDFTLDNTNGTAYHKKTGLTWKRCHEGWDWNGATCVDNTSVADAYTWSAALQLGPASTFAGFSDWRLPNQKELNSIVEQRNWNPAINATVFPNTPPTDYFWSASPMPPMPTTRGTCSSTVATTTPASRAATTPCGWCAADSILCFL